MYIAIGCGCDSYYTIHCKHSCGSFPGDIPVVKRNDSNIIAVCACVCVYVYIIVCFLCLKQMLSDTQTHTSAVYKEIKTCL